MFNLFFILFLVFSVFCVRAVFSACAFYSVSLFSMCFLVVLRHLCGASGARGLIKAPAGDRGLAPGVDRV